MCDVCNVKSKNVKLTIDPSRAFYYVKLNLLFLALSAHPDHLRKQYHRRERLTDGMTSPIRSNPREDGSHSRQTRTLIKYIVDRVFLYWSTSILIGCHRNLRPERATKTKHLVISSVCAALSWME